MDGELTTAAYDIEIYIRISRISWFQFIAYEMNLHPCICIELSNSLGNRMKGA